MDRKYNIIADESVASQAGDILRGITEERLIGISNRGIYKRAVRDLEAADKISAVYENGMLKVDIGDISVLLDRDIAKSRCSCPSKVICRHIVAAACAVMQLKGESSDGGACSEAAEEEKSAEKKSPSENIDKDYPADVMKAAVNILSKGIINCTENDSGLFVSLSVRGGSAYSGLSALCRSFASEVESMNQRSAAFSRLGSTMLLCRIYNTAEAVLNGHGDELMKNSGYEASGRGTFVCLGVYPHRSESGYAGATAVCYETERREFFTYNASLPFFYKATENAGNPKEIEKLAGKRIHWQNGVSLFQLCGKRFTLVNFKSDERRRISSSKQTACLIGETLDVSELPVEIFTEPDEGEYDYFSPRRDGGFFLVRNPLFSNVHYNEPMQSLEYTINGSNTDGIACALSYNEVNRRLTEYIERYRDYPLDDSLLLIRKYSGKCFPVSIIGSEVRNICF